MTVFDLAPDYGCIRSIVSAIVDDDEDYVRDLLEDLLPKPQDGNFDARPALQAAWASYGAPKTAARIALARIQGWHDEEDEPDEQTALETWARKYAILLRGCLTEPATPGQIAEALATLADVLGQDIGEQTAAFIIEIIGDTELPVYIVNTLFHHVALHEAGRIKPASFTRLLPCIKEHWRKVLRSTDVRLFVDQLEPALTYVREHLTDEPPRGGFD